jgi:hypothetical protein
MKLHYENAPSTLWHSFVMTEENGAKLYGVCLIVFERLSRDLLAQMRTLSDSWKLDTSKLVRHRRIKKD